MPSRTVMSVASATRLFAAGTTADDTLCRVTTGKDSREAFIESSADQWHGLTGLLRSAHLYGGFVASFSSRTSGAEATQTAHLPTLTDGLRQRRNRRSWHLSRV